MISYILSKKENTHPKFSNNLIFDINLYILYQFDIARQTNQFYYMLILMLMVDDFCLKLKNFIYFCIILYIVQLNYKNLIKLVYKIFQKSNLYLVFYSIFIYIT